MTEFIWAIKLKLKAIRSEVKWNFKLRDYTLENFKKMSQSTGQFLMLHGIIFSSDMVKILGTSKEILGKKLILIPLIVLLVLFTYYVSLINGKPDKELFEEQYFPKFYYDTAIEIRDLQDRLAGSMAQPQSLSTQPSLFLEKTPNFFWNLLQEKYDASLNFEDNATSFAQSLVENPFYYNGVDITASFKETKDLMVNIVTKQSLEVQMSPTLTEQLMHGFLRKEPSWRKKTNIERLGLTKTFFHALKQNNGMNFKAWLLSTRSFFFVANKGYGFKDCAEIFFGRKVEDLSMEQQAIMVALYRYPYQLNVSLKEKKASWKKIKAEAIAIVKASELIDKHYALVSKIEKMPLPKLPYFPDVLMEVVGKITPQNQAYFSTLPLRSKRLLNSIKEVVNQELDKLFQSYSISPKSRLVTQLGINFLIAPNYYFNHYLNKELDDSKLSSFWISIVNEEGEFVRLYQKNSAYQTPPQIGNLGKIFSLLLFANRGDKYHTKYCNKSASDEIVSEKGYAKCTSGSWVDARRLFSSSTMLPLYDGFIKYRQKSRRGDSVFYTPIYMKSIEALYQNLALVPLQNNEPRVDLGAGKLQMTPLDMQVALHKITQLIYRPNTVFYGAKLIKSFDYHTIKEGVILPELKHYSLDSPEQVSPTFQAFFSQEKRVTLQTLLKAPISQRYGSLQWLKNYKNIKFIFAQESHKHGIHWLVGAFKKSDKLYSFTLHVKDDKLSKYALMQEMKKILEKSMQSMNSPHKMKYDYMKQVFRD